MSKILRITAKRAGFRRAGLAHSTAPTDHPISAFSSEQLAALRNEAMLTVIEIDVDDRDPGDESVSPNTSSAAQADAGAARNPAAPAEAPAQKAPAKTGKKKTK